MPAQSREQLKKYFRNGALVREEYFTDLIDSMVNKISDKVEPTSDGGVGLTPSASGNRYLSFFTDAVNEKNNTPSYALHAIGDQQQILSLGIQGAKKDELKSVVAFKTVTNAEGNTTRIGVNTINPVYDLHVNGRIGNQARLGCYYDPKIDYKQVKADGNWYKILDNLKGVNAYEIILQTAEPNGKYAMSYSVITIAHAVSKKVRPIRQDYKWWWQRLQLRVVEKNGIYGIEVRTAMKYQGAPIIYPRITKLWN